MAIAWLHVERPGEWAAAAALVGLALASVLPRRGWERAGAAAGVAWLGLALVLDAPLTDPRGAVDELWRGLVAFYEVTLPFDPARDPEMAGIVLVAILAASLAIAQLAASGWTLPAVIVAAAATAWPATLVGRSDDLLYGALALSSMLWLLAIARRRPLRAVVVAACAGGLVVVAAVAAASTGLGPTSAGVEWKRWDLFADHTARVAVSYAWDANYDGVSFPTKSTTVLRVRADARPRYWRASTLDVFSDDRWLEYLRPLGSVQGRGRVPQDALSPAGVERPEGWLEQRVQIGSLRDTRLVAAGTPMAYDIRTHGTTLVGEGGALRVPVGLRRGDRYVVWSYVADPVPRALDVLGPTYPRLARRYLEAFGREFPAFGAPGRAATMDRLFAEPGRSASAYAPLYERARTLAERERSPYRVVLAIESWLRSRGGFRYVEQPPHTPGLPPLVDFVTTTKAGYCQHFAGSMALMLRLLGIPSRVAVGFTSGSLRGREWIVTDHNAHAWVEVWFPRYGWIPFDPTPGRGRLTGAYSFASESARAAAELGAGRLPGRDEVERLAEAPATASADEPVFDIPVVMLILVLLVVAGVAALLLVKYVRTKTRYLPRQPRKRAAAAQAELVSFLCDQGLAVGRTSTVSELRTAAREAYGVRLDAFAAAVGRAGFASAPSARDAERARTELRRSLRALRQSLGPWRRLRGALSVRSLRDG